MTPARVAAWVAERVHGPNGDGDSDWYMRIGDSVLGMLSNQERWRHAIERIVLAALQSSPERAALEQIRAMNRLTNILATTKCEAIEETCRRALKEAACEGSGGVSGADGEDTTSAPASADTTATAPLSPSTSASDAASASSDDNPPAAACGACGGRWKWWREDRDGRHCRDDWHLLNPPAAPRGEGGRCPACKGMGGHGFSYERECVVCKGTGQAAPVAGGGETEEACGSPSTTSEATSSSALLKPSPSAARTSATPAETASTATPANASTDPERRESTAGSSTASSPQVSPPPPADGACDQCGGTFECVRCGATRPLPRRGGEGDVMAGTWVLARKCGAGTWIMARRMETKMATKTRRVIVTLEVETSLPLSILKSKDEWTMYSGGIGEYLNCDMPDARLVQVQANVIRQTGAPRTARTSRARKGKR